jgi:plasmid stabilization system protein ParE
MKRYKLVMTAFASVELKEEVRYSAENWGKKHAREYHRDLQKCMKEITQSPYMYALKPHLGVNIRSVDYKGTRIVYRVDEEQKLVEILGFPSIHNHKTFEG